MPNYIEFYIEYVTQTFPKSTQLALIRKLFIEGDTSEYTPSK